VKLVTCDPRLPQLRRVGNFRTPALSEFAKPQDAFSFSHHIWARRALRSTKPAQPAKRRHPFDLGWSRKAS
jgi:hypothetical protein